MTQKERTRIANERLQKAFDMRSEGKTYREIGEALGGVCVERARQLVYKYRRIARYKAQRESGD